MLQPQGYSHLRGFRSALLVASIAAALLATGCKKAETPAKPETVKGAKDKAAKKDEKKADDSAKKGDKAGADTAPECDAYAKKLCEIAGPTSGTCGQIKTVLSLLPAKACQAGMTDVAYTKTRIVAMNKSCNDLMDKLCGDLGEETKTCKMVRAKTTAFGPEKCTEMLNDYPKILAQLKQMEDANKPLTAEKMAMLNKDAAGEYGPKNAKVTVVEFSDFQCPYCGRAATSLINLKKKYKGKVRFLFHNFPLGFHKNAHLAAEAGMAAREQGKFWEMHDLMFANQKALERPNLEKYAKKIGLDMEKFKAALDSGKFKAVVDASIKLGSLVAVRGTPTMFINGARVNNPSDVDAVSKQIDALLNK